ncbi:3-oxoacyl-ACP reductase FabG [Calderihabitans maritimus]|uniref:3-oxoacyl-[acyl-carrier-protein] reductase n=1 Tax=Calderihabitans maritimus TaxID=1246530 RepID=A0A1Z5HW98_9FIRM|nr:3-oxoacyl-ACP reductase FabG [Calderihabitans maritimus]GAW93812.1 short-chain dehydrogenase [Calderihabitans maritimus]
MRLKDKVAIITGGAKGIGEETSLLFAKEGAKVVIVDYDEEAGKSVVKKLEELGTEVLFFEADVTDRESIQQITVKTKEKFGRIDILINNAGITADAFLTKMSEEQWDRVIAVNLKGVYNCTQAVAPVMLEQGSGVILNASSVVGIYGNIGQTNYAATKAGVIGMTKSWAKELGPKGIRVNAVAPGFIVTDMTAKVPEKVLEFMRSKTPLGRLGQPRDVAAAYLFLASDEASFINGQVLGVDGGLVI